MHTYEEMLIAVENLDYAAQLRLAMHILNNLTTAIPVEDEAEKDSFRKTLPRLIDLYNKGYVKQGDIVYLLPIPKKKLTQRERSTVLKDHNNVEYNGEVMSINEWARRVYDYKGVNIYDQVMLERENKTLKDIRNEYIKQYGFTQKTEE